MNSNSSKLFEFIDKNDFLSISNLIDEGVNVNDRGSNNLTPLMLACSRGLSNIVELLINAGADIYTVDSILGASALHKAAQSGVVEVAQMLLEKGAFINFQSAATGHTPLIDAVWCVNKCQWLNIF